MYLSQIATRHQNAASAGMFIRSSAARGAYQQIEAIKRIATCYQAPERRLSWHVHQKQRCQGSLSTIEAIKGIATCYQAPERRLSWHVHQKQRCQGSLSTIKIDRKEGIDR
jgi:hypothetical protein